MLGFGFVFFGFARCLCVYWVFCLFFLFFQFFFFFIIIISGLIGGGKGYILFLGDCVCMFLLLKYAFGGRDDDFRI